MIYSATIETEWSKEITFKLAKKQRVRKIKITKYIQIKLFKKVVQIVTTKIYEHLLWKNFGCWKLYKLDLKALPNKIERVDELKNPIAEK